MRQLLALTILAMFLTGCGSVMVKEEDIINYDPEFSDIGKDGEQYVPAEQATPDHVVVADLKGVAIDVSKGKPVYDEQAKAELQQWDVFATNSNRKDKCVGVVWRLLDFRFITNYPTDFFMEKSSMLHLGVMQQTTITVDGVKVAPPPSGYVKAMRVRAPNDEALDDGDRCTFVEPEGRVIEK